MSTERPCDMMLRLALARGRLERDSNRGWRFGRRHFSYDTVRRAIDRGDAVCDGKTVCAVQQESSP